METFIIGEDFKARIETDRPIRQKYDTQSAFMSALREYNYRNAYEIACGKFTPGEVKGQRVTGFLRDGIFYVENILK